MLWHSGYSALECYTTRETGMRPNLAVYEVGLLLGVLMNQAEVGFMLQMLPADTEYKQILLV